MRSKRCLSVWWLKRFAVALLLSALVAIPATKTAAQSTEVLQAQIELQARGYDPGPLDGFMGRRTRRALRQYQEDIGVPATGVLDEATLETLSAQEPEPQAEPALPQTPVLTPFPPTEQLGPTPTPDVVQPDDFEVAPVQPQPSLQSGTTPETGTSAEPSPEFAPSASTEPNDTGQYGIVAALITLVIVGLILYWIVLLPYRSIRRLFSKAKPHRQRMEEPSVTVKATQPYRVAKPELMEKPALPVGSKNELVREPNNAARSSAPAPKYAKGWVPAGDIVEIAGRRIEGMVFVGSGPKTGPYADPDNAFINPALNVARVGGDYKGEELPYWPNYSQISTKARATYLDWLATGRKDPDYEVGYVFLFFYGLERRTFVDRTDAVEAQAIMAEVARLREIYGHNYSIQRYLGAFLDTASLLFENDDAQPVFDRPGYEMPLSVALALGRKAGAGEALDADWLLSWLMCDPECRLRTPAKRVFPEFRALFDLLFNARHPEGLKIRAPKRKLKVIYQAASGNFEMDLGQITGPVPDISTIRKPLSIAQDIADEATATLDKFSRYLGRHPDGRGSAEAHALLPEALWPLFPSAELEELRAWGQGKLDAGGLVPVMELIERLTGAHPLKISKRDLTGAADALARLSIGMAPDPRFALRSPKADEPIVLFPLPQGETALETVSALYPFALISLTLATFVGHADGTVVADERRQIIARIDATPGLSASERARLNANLLWLIAVPPNLSALRSRLKAAPGDARVELGRIALATAAADGNIHPKEIAAIEKLYGVLGLDVDGVYSELHALSTDGPVSVYRPEALEIEHSIPSPPGDAPRPLAIVTLDATRIAAIMADTSRVSQVLGDIFQR